MRYETILYEAADDVVTVTLALPDTLNALTAQMRSDLAHAVRRAPGDGRALVIAGMGEAFCAGQDLGDARSVRDLDPGRTLRDEYLPLLEALRDAPVPTLAAVNGDAAGAGASLALAADVTVAAERARFTLTFSRIGLVPDAGATWQLARRVGRARALGMALLAEPVTARAAAAWGLIWEAVPDADFAARVAARARALAAGPTEAFRLTRETVDAAFTADWGAQMEAEAAAQADAARTRDFLEGVVALHEGRAPGFEGR